MVGNRLLATGESGVSALLEDGTDAERALREALEGLIVPALCAGVPRRVLDFVAGGEERALQCEVILLVDQRIGGVLGDENLDALMGGCDDYREATVQLLLHALWHPWHPWQNRLRMHARLYKVNLDEGTAKKGADVKGVGNVGFDDYGTAFVNGSICLGQPNSNLLKVDPATGESTVVGQVTPQPGQGGWAVPALGSR